MVAERTGSRTTPLRQEGAFRRCLRISAGTFAYNATHRRGTLPWHNRYHSRNRTFSAGEIMGRKLLALCLFVGATGFATLAVAQCPPGQTYIPLENRCAGMGESPICPPGTQFDPRQNRCMEMAQPENRCPPGQSFDTRNGNCMSCPPGQTFDSQANRCVGGPSPGPAPGRAPAPAPSAPPKCPPGQNFDAHQNRCVAAGPAPAPGSGSGAFGGPSQH